MDISIKDTLFAHSQFSTDFQISKYIKWNRNENTDLCFYTDTSLKMVDENIKKKIGWLLESPEITKSSYKWIYNNNNKFNFVLTHNKNLLDRNENFKFCPTGGCWIEEKDHKIYQKNKLVSIIASDKRMTDTQVLRHKVIYYNKNKIDIFGRGYNPIKYKLDALKDYMFSITIENCQEDFYFTEKLIDCFMTGTIPIYVGCPSIGNFFNLDGMVIVNSLDDINKILNEISEEKYMTKIDGIKDNFERAKEYLIAEDYIWEKYNNLFI